MVERRKYGARVRRKCMPKPPRKVLPIQQGKVTEVGKERRAGRLEKGEHRSRYAGKSSSLLHCKLLYQTIEIFGCNLRITQ